MNFRIIIILIITFTWISAAHSQEKDLDFYIQQGLVNSPLLKDLNNQIRSNTLDSLLIKAQRVPQINFNGQFSYAPIINGYGYSEAITNGGNFITTINLSQPLFNTKTVNARYTKIGIQNQSLDNTAKLSKTELEKSITAQYLTAYSVHADIMSSQAILTSLEEQDNILKTLTDQGIFRQTDYLSFKVEVQARRIQQTELRIQYRRELSTLNNLCGMNDTTAYALSLPDLQVNFPVNTAQSLHFLRFRFDSLGIQNDKLLLDRSYKPVVNWVADAGLINNDPSVIYKNFGASIGLSLSLPVYDGNQRKLNYEKLKNAEETRIAYEHNVHNQVDEELNQLNRELEMTREMIPRITEELDLAGTIIRQDKDLFNSGGVSITDYLLAVRNFISIQQYLNQYQVKILQIINEINYWKQ